MGKFSALAAAGLAFASLISAVPIEATTNNVEATENAGAAQIQAAIDVAEQIKLAGEIGNTRSIMAACAGQSCQIAALSGSTGVMPIYRPVGGDEAGYACISKYSPETVKAVRKLPFGKAAPSNGPFGVLALGFAGMMDIATGPHLDKGKYTCGCKKNIVIYARGTTEIGVMGEIVGPFLSNNLSPSSDWEICGVYYTANLSGDYCVGLPGGMVARDMLNQAAQKCPEAKIFMAGYSEGGMVSHNAVAYADEAARKRVAAVVAWGDPFQGAPIKGYSGPILTYCASGDDVCTGNFVIGFVHLSYAAGYSVQQGAKAMMDIAAGKSVKSNKRYADGVAYNI